MIDEEALSSAKTQYATEAKDMQDLKDRLKQAVEDLKTGWDTDAGKAFIKKFEDNLYKNMQLYADTIQHMSDNMGIATSKYDAVFREAEQLKL